MSFYIISFLIINLLIYIKREFLIKAYDIYDVPDNVRKNIRLEFLFLEEQSFKLILHFCLYLY